MKRRILLVDRDESVRKMLARVLETAGYLALGATSIAEALERVRLATPELLLVDLETPDEWRDFEQFRRVQPQLPLIVLTGWPISSQQSLPPGITAMMEKPLDLSLLLQQISSVMPHREESGSPAPPDFIAAAETVHG